MGKATNNALNPCPEEWDGILSKEENYIINLNQLSNIKSSIIFKIRKWDQDGLPDNSLNSSFSAENTVKTIANIIK